MAVRLREWIRPFYLKWLYFRLRPESKPRYWTDSFQFPVAAPAAHGGADLLILPMVDWHARMQRPQHLARALARRGFRCFFLNIGLGREFPYPVRCGSRLSARQLEPGVVEVHAGLPREPVYHDRVLSAGENDELFALLTRCLDSFHGRPAAILCQFPLWTDVACRLRERYRAPLIYDCHDLLSGFSRISSEIISVENALFKQADTVVFTAKSLLERMVEAHPYLLPKSTIVRNGVDVGHFQAAGGGRGKTVGYVGSLDEWFDVEAVRAAALRLAHVQFVLLGRVESAKVRSLEGLPNVRFYGEIPYDRLPGYMAEFDVALIPFLLNPLTDATNPIKMYEYFSCGLPVVSTRLPEVVPFDGLVYLAGDSAEFGRQVEAALAEKDDSLRSLRRGVAKAESWDARAVQFERAIASSPLATMER